MMINCCCRKSVLPGEEKMASNGGNKGQDKASCSNNISSTTEAAENSTRPFKRR